MTTRDNDTENDGDLLSLDEAVEALKSSRSTVYRWLRTGKLKGTKIGRQWRIHRDDVRRFLEGESPRIESSPGVRGFVDDLEEMLSDHDVDMPDADGRSLAMEAVHAMSRLAVVSRAEQFAVEPHLGDDGRVEAWFRMRVDGVLDTHAAFDPRALPSIVKAVKMWAGCDPHREREIQNGRATGPSEDDTAPPEFRVTIVPTALGESAGVTVLDPKTAAEYINLDRLDYHPDDRARIDRALASPWGTTVVTGPSGTGKTTFLYACLTKLAGPHNETFAVEPVTEWRVPGVVHVPIDDDRGVTIPAAIRAALRCDVDVLMVAENRDEETLQLTFTAALAGHSVLTSLHAPDAAAALLRATEFGLEPHAVSESTRVVVAQRLVRRLCDACAVEHTPDSDELARARKLAEEGGLDRQELRDDWRQAVGCTQCGQTGYRGRRVIAETLEPTGAVAEALRDGAEADALREVAVANGMTTIAADGIRRAAAGETTLDEVWRVLGT